MGDSPGTASQGTGAASPGRHGGCFQGGGGQGSVRRHPGPHDLPGTFEGRGYGFGKESEGTGSQYHG